jgi:hypothetical protein
MGPDGLRPLIDVAAGCSWLDQTRLEVVQIDQVIQLYQCCPGCESGMRRLLSACNSVLCWLQLRWLVWIRDANAYQEHECWYCARFNSLGCKSLLEMAVCVLAPWSCLRKAYYDPSGNGILGGYPAIFIDGLVLLPYIIILCGSFGAFGSLVTRLGGTYSGGPRSNWVRHFIST